MTFACLAPRKWIAANRLRNTGAQQRLCVVWFGCLRTYFSPSQSRTGCGAKKGTTANCRVKEIRRPIVSCCGADRRYYCITAGWSLAQRTSCLIFKRVYETYIIYDVPNMEYVQADRVTRKISRTR